jgi:hypothetical protein
VLHRDRKIVLSEVLDAVSHDEFGAATLLFSNLLVRVHPHEVMEEC